jgi:hypothetical protein
MATLEPGEHYDIILLHGEGDDENATKLKKILQRFVRLSGHRKVSFYPEERFGFDQFDWLDEGLNHSSLKFILFNRNTVADTWATFQRHNALKAMLRRQDKSIVPVKLHRDVRVPNLLDIYPAVDVYKLLKECHLDTVQNVDELEDANIDSDLLKRIANAIDSSYRSQSRDIVAQPEVQLDSEMTETCNYIHWSYIIFQAGLQCVRQLLDELIRGDMNLAGWLESMQAKYPKIRAFKEARDKLRLDNSVESPPTSDNFDLTLLFALLDVGLNDQSEDKLGKNWTEEERENLKQICKVLKKKRNDCAHTTSCRMTTELYMKEVKELHEILVTKLSKYKCKPDMKCWNMWPLIQQNIGQMSPNDRCSMMELVKEVQTSNSELQRLSGKVDELMASQQSKADYNGTKDGLLNMISNGITKLWNILNKSSTIDDTSRSARDQYEQDFDASLVDRVAQVDHALQTADADVGKKPAEKGRRREEANVVGTDEWMDGFGSLHLNTPD